MFSNNKFNRIKKFRDWQQQMPNSNNELLKISKQKTKYTTVQEIRSWQKKIIGLCFLLIVLYLFYSIVYSAKFKITKVEISGLQNQSTEEINQIVNSYWAKKYFLIIPHDNILFFNSKNFKKVINEKIALNQLSIKKVGWHQLNITVQEKIYLFIINVSGRYYYLDSDGKIIKEIFTEEINDNYKIIKINDSQTIKINDIILTKDRIDRFKKAISSIESLSLIEIDHLNWEFKLPDEIEIITKQGINIKMDLNNNLAEKIINLNELLKQKIDENVKIKSIDLMSNKWIYYE